MSDLTTAAQAGAMRRPFWGVAAALGALVVLALVPPIATIPLGGSTALGDLTDAATSYTRVLSAVLLLILAREDATGGPELVGAAAALALTGLARIVLGFEIFTDRTGLVLGAFTPNSLELAARAALPVGLAFTVARRWERAPPRLGLPAPFALTAAVTLASATLVLGVDVLVTDPLRAERMLEVTGLAAALVALALLARRGRERALWPWALATAVTAMTSTWARLVAPDLTIAWYVGLGLSLASASVVLIGATLQSASRSRQASVLRVRSEYEARLEHLALHDAATDLPNAVQIQKRVDEELAAGRQAALLAIALEGVGPVYEAFGQQHVDALMRAAAGRIAGELSGAAVSRVGDEELAAALPARHDLLAVANRAVRALDEPLEVEGALLAVGAAGGCAVAPRDAPDGEILLRHAMRAARTARQRGRQALEWAPDMQPYDAEDLLLLSQLRPAIDAGELVLHYQPKARTSDRRVVGVEALVRWQHPERGLLAPAAFIPLAERTGVIDHLTHWAIRRACARAQEWSRGGLALSVAVNLPARTIEDRELPAHLEEALEATGVDPAALRLEVTESGAMRDIGRGRRRLAMLRAMGVGLSIDDFGTGYSSLAYLAQLPIDEVKIDASFVRAMRDDPKAATIVRSSIELCHQLGFVATAEGAEDEETWSALAGAGCDLVQGYFVGRPLPPDDLLAHLRSTGWALAE